MDIYRNANKPDEFCIFKLSPEDIVDMKAICEQLSGSLMQLLRLPEDQFIKVVKSDVSIDRTKEDMRRMIATCAKYGAAFVEYNAKPTAINIELSDERPTSEDKES